MIWTTAAKRILKELGDGNSVLTLDSLTIQIDDTSFSGRGSLEKRGGGFNLIVRFDAGSSVEGYFKSLLTLQGPRIYSREDCWHVTATTVRHVSFSCAAFPSHNALFDTNGIRELICRTDKLTLQPGALDLTDFGLLADKNDVEDAAHVSEGSRIKPHSEFHAILPGVKCVLAQHGTKIKRNNVFLGESSSQRLDTFIDETEDRRIALVEEDGDLHVFLELHGVPLSEEDELTSFGALLDAVAFTHGCQPFPSLKEHSRKGRVASCEISAIERLEHCAIRPVDDVMPLGFPEVRSMLGLAFDFYQQNNLIIGRVRNAMWRYRDTAKKSVPISIQVLMVCTLFEGLIASLFEANGLKNPTKDGEPALTFATNKQAAKDLLMEKHRKDVPDGDAESDWSRMAGYLDRCDYIRPKEKLKALAGHFGFAWEGDVEDIHHIWNRHRNALAHGSDVKINAETGKDLFIAWSRLSGAIHRFILAEMGYEGRFAYSPMEKGMEIFRLGKSTNLNETS